VIVLQVFFWFAIAWIAYANVGYLALLLLLARFIRRPVAQADVTPSVSLLIAAHNEEAVLAAKLENSLALDYPRERLEIIVVSDASTDRTDEIASAYAGRGVRLLRVAENHGKVHALNLAVPTAGGEILVFSDADSTYAPDALRKLVRNFADPRVGAVTGEERRVAGPDASGLGESLYCRLDNRIKRLEGQIGSTVMVNGGFFALRRELYPPLPPHLVHDALVPCLLHLRGYRTAYEQEARSVETYPLDARGDFRRRVRTVLQAFSSYMSAPAALNPLRSGFFALQVFSHRFSRWFVLPWLAVALVAGAVLSPDLPLYRWLLAGQALCYALALAGGILERRGVRVKVFYLPYYFLYIHAAAFVAIAQALGGKRVSTWRPTTRAAVSRPEERL